MLDTQQGEPQIINPSFHPSSTKSMAIKDHIIRQRHWLLALMGLTIIVLQIVEHESLADLSASFFVEIFLFIILLFVVSLLLDSAVRTIENRTRSSHLLELKHSLSLRLAAAQNHDELTKIIVNFPSSFISPTYTALLFYDPILDEFFLKDEVKNFEGETPSFYFSEPWKICEQCKKTSNNKAHSLSNCKLYALKKPSVPRNGYCFPLWVGNELIGVLHVHLPADEKFVDEQIDMLQEVSFEIAIALKSDEQQRQITELKSAEAAVSERNKIFRDLHDVLGQNLVYLNLQLGLLSRNASALDEKQQTDLSKMRDVAGESYEIVRDTLDALRSSTSPFLSSLLNHQSNLIARQGSFSYSFREIGQPRPLSTLVLHNTYYICKEAINNINKHSAAHNVEGKLIWGEKDLMIEISDDGKGFNAQDPFDSNHYGLSIMNERVNQINGRLDICSENGMGTKLTVWIPIN